MKGNLIIAGIFAMAFHAAALFGPFRGTPPKPLPIAEDSVEVELTTAAEEAAAPPDRPAEPPPEPPPVPDPVPPPEEIPTPLPEPVSEIVKKPELEKPPVIPPKARPPSAKVKLKPASTSAPNGTATTSPSAKSGPTTGVRIRSNPKPLYPLEARRARQEGTVILDVQVSADGIPLSVSLAHSSGFPSLDRAAVAAARAWRFEPAQTAGVAIRSRVQVPVRFQLH